MSIKLKLSFKSFSYIYSIPPLRQLSFLIHNLIMSFYWIKLWGHMWSLFIVQQGSALGLLFYALNWMTTKTTGHLDSLGVWISSVLYIAQKHTYATDNPGVHLDLEQPWTWMYPGFFEISLKINKMRTSIFVQ